MSFTSSITWVLTLQPTMILITLLIYTTKIFLQHSIMEKLSIKRPTQFLFHPKHEHRNCSTFIDGIVENMNSISQLVSWISNPRFYREIVWRFYEREKLYFVLHWEFCLKLVSTNKNTKVSYIQYCVCL